MSESQKIMYVCEVCVDNGESEWCGRFDPDELHVAPDGRQVCDNCWDELRYHGLDSEDLPVPFDELPPIQRWQPIS